MEVPAQTNMEMTGSPGSTLLAEYSLPSNSPTPTDNNPSRSIELPMATDFWRHCFDNFGSRVSNGSYHAPPKAGAVNTHKNGKSRGN